MITRSSPVWLLFLTVAAGCSSSGPRAAPVVPETARTALRTTLDAWKAGQTPESLNQASPPIVAQDIDWLGGSKLLAYQVLDDGTPEDANLRVPVELKLKDKSGRETTRKVVYVVGTDPKVTVFRAME